MEDVATSLQVPSPTIQTSGALVTQRDNGIQIPEGAVLVVRIAMRMRLAAAFVRMRSAVLRGRIRIAVCAWPSKGSSTTRATSTTK